ncbi:Tetratricopeptide-like helical [Penicillium hispanicum]|uniref:Tetratricopeptide-like helical n=1 Tax=Penicillium hispanicum TaxID=1080232 RepID=UPI0025408403|nr:Tetratricopeptide-like helical [Penicillium hispanicum]KAJ5584341.1 Tetratricopeptide-like helical [Penicillium hispanicum]
MSDSKQLTEIWNQAIHKYEEITKKRVDDPALRGVTTVNALLELVERENRAFSNFRDKGNRIFETVKLAMSPIEALGDIAAGGASVVCQPSTIVFNGVKYLLDAAKGVSAKYDAIIELMTSLKDFTVRLEVYSQHDISQELRSKLAEILTTILEVLALARQEIKRGRLLSYGKNVLLGGDGGGSAAVAKLSQLIKSETALVGAETLTHAKVTHSTLSRVDQNVDRIDERLQRIEAGLQERHKLDQDAMSRIRQMLQPNTGAEDRYNAMQRSRTPKTADWILEEPNFKNWIDREKPILWVSGNPGAGKSYLASNIVRHLKEPYPEDVQGQPTSIGFFFFKDDNPKTRSPRQALCNIAWQIAQNDWLYSQYIADCIQSEDIETLPSLWQKLFVNFFISDKDRGSRVYLVLDALDEAFSDERAELFELAKDIQPEGRIHLLMLGRPQIAEEINDLIEMLKVPTIHVSEVNNFQDIVHYVETSIARSIYLRKLPKDLRSEIVQKVSTGAQGMFFWAGLMLQELLRIRSLGGIRKALNIAPKGLSKMIRHVLRGLSENLQHDPEHADDLNELLAWITCAKIPLSLSLVDHVLKWKSSDGEGWIWLEGSLRVQFASIFSLNRDDGLTTADLQQAAEKRVIDGDGSYDEDDEPDALEDRGQFNSDVYATTVTFNHASLGDFFRNEGVEISAGDNAPSIVYNHQEAQLLVLRRCLGVINFTDSGDKVRRRSAYNIIFYACQLVVGHLRDVDITKTSKDTKQAIGLGLGTMLSSEDSINNFFPNTTHLFSRDVVDLFNTWLRDPDAQALFTPEIKSWYHEAMSENQVDILHLAARIAASDWLRHQGEEGHSEALSRCATVFNFINLRNDRPISQVDSVEKVLEAANWSGLDVDATWYRNVGKILRQLNLFDHAIVQYQKALGLNPSSWQAHFEMAKMYKSQDKYDAAIGLYKVAAERLEAQRDSLEKYELTENRHIIHDAYHSIGKCYRRLEDWQTAIIHHRKGYDWMEYCEVCAAAILECCHKEQRYDEALSFLRHMDEPMPSKKPYKPLTCLNIFLWYRCSSIDDFDSLHFDTIILHTDSILFFMHAYRSAIAAAYRRGKTVSAGHLELSLARLYETYGHDLVSATNIWERLIKKYHGIKPEGPLWYVVCQSSIKLTSVYLARCLQPDISDAERQKCGEWLESSMEGRPLDSSDDNCGPVIPKGSLIGSDARTWAKLGHFYELCGLKDQAISSFKMALVECVPLLSGGNSLDDVFHYATLADTLAGLGDEKKFAAVRYYSSMLNATRSKQDELSMGCDLCGLSYRVDALAHCSYCVDTDLCPNCLASVKAGTPRINICGSSHPWKFVPQPPQPVVEWTEAQRGMLYVDGTWVGVEEFKNCVKVEYDL